MTFPDPTAHPAKPLAHPARVVGLSLLGLLALLLALSTSLHDRIVSGIELLRVAADDHPIGGGVLFVLLAAASAMLVLFSGALLVPVGIQAWGTVTCFLLLWAGWWLGGLVTYGIGRAFGQPIVARLVPEPKRARLEAQVGANLPLPAALLVLLGLPSDVVGYLFGAARYPAGRYLLALLLAELPYAWGTVFLGAAFLEREILPLVLGTVAALAVFAWHRRVRRIE